MTALTNSSVRWISRQSSIEVVALEDKLETESVQTASTGFSDLTGVIQVKMVSFAEPLVTRSWVVERAPTECKQSMYYTPNDILR